MGIRSIIWLGRAALFALLLTTPAAAQTAIEPGLAAALDAACADAGIPGCVVLLDYPDGTRRAAAWGSADLERDVPLERGDLLRAGSITKTYIAVLALKLAADGYFDLDDRAIDYVGPENHLLKEALNPEAVTVRQLLGHEAGIPDSLAQLRDAVPWLLDVFDGDGQIRQSLPQLAGDGEPFAPGTNCRYSNTGYILAGEVMEAATGRELAVLLYHYIFQPLGLEHTYYAATEKTPPQARGYILTDEEFADVTLFDRPELAGAAGAVLASADDLATFGRALFGGGAASGGQSALLTPEQLAELTSLHGMEGGGEYGMGVFRRELSGHAVWGHPGATVGHRAELWYVPDTGVVAVALANCGRAPLKQIIEAVLEATGD